MSEPSMVYVVTHGVYSDYHIVAVFDNEDAAKLYASTYKNPDAWTDDPCTVEVFSLNDTSPIAVDYYEANVCDTPDKEGHGGAHQGIQQRHTHDWVTMQANYPNAWYWTAQQRVMPTGAYYGNAVALDPDTATKIARDAMYQFKADREGLT